MCGNIGEACCEGEVCSPGALCNVYKISHYIPEHHPTWYKCTACGGAVVSNGPPHQRYGQRACNGELHILLPSAVPAALAESQDLLPGFLVSLCPD
jgi:hypothetical protein